MIAVAVFLAAGSAQAHHGVGSVGSAGLEGPGAPVETSISTTLPAHSFLVYTKLDYASYELMTPERDDEGLSAAYWMFGAGYGFASWFSGYLFVPYYAKVLEDNSYNTAGFADISLIGTLGLKWDRGLRLQPASESLDDMEDWHFTIYGGLTLPTGNANLADGEGNIDPGMSLGFGKPSFTAGANTTKMVSSRATLIGDVSGIWFQEYQYDDETRGEFGTEFRANLAWAQRLGTSREKGIRFDGILEANYLWLGRDLTDGLGEPATGGKILYVQPGCRLYVNNFTAAVGVKFPAWTELNEEDLQQGAEGTEDYRLEFTFSTLF
jgi:hypothetical protein